MDLRNKLKISWLLKALVVPTHHLVPSVFTKTLWSGSFQSKSLHIFHGFAQNWTKNHFVHDWCWPNYWFYCPKTVAHEGLVQMCYQLLAAQNYPEGHFSRPVWLSDASGFSLLSFGHFVCAANVALADSRSSNNGFSSSTFCVKLKWRISNLYHEWSQIALSGCRTGWHTARWKLTYTLSIL